MSPIETEMTVALSQQLRAAGHGERTRLKEQACRAMGVSMATLHARLKRVGYDTGRKARADRGTTAADEHDLENLAALIWSTMRADGRRGLSFDTAVSILRADGKLACALSTSQLARILRTRGLHPQQLAEQKAAVQARTLHPNHLWQLDASVCRLYYLSNGRLGLMSEAEFNRNKPRAFERIAKDRLIRYVLEDHYSGAFRFRYYLGSETAANLTDFVIYGVGRYGKDPFHGVPQVFMMDPGAANTAGMTRNLIERLHAQIAVNQVMSPRSKGGVESAQYIIETQFEARLAARSVLSLDEINAEAARFALWFNSTRIHTRHGRTRYDVWLQIRPHELRIAPPVEVLRDLVTTQPETREVSRFLTVSYRGREYDVARAPWIFPNAKVRVCLNPYRLPAIEVETCNPDAPAETALTIAEPVERDAAGFRADAPVLGETYRVAADTVVDRNRKRLDQRMYGVDSFEEAQAAKKRRARPMADVNTFADVEATVLPDYIAKRGEQLRVERRGVEVMPLSIAEACRRLKDALGHAYGAHVYRWVETKFGAAGVPEEQIEAIAAQFAAVPNLRSPDERAPLRAVGSGE